MPSALQRTGQVQGDISMNITIIQLPRAAVKLAITADLVLLLAALGSLNIPTTIAALLALNLLCGLYFKEASRHEEI
nr:MAG: hypothetical protein [Bacteriophage sp.]